MKLLFRIPIILLLSSLLFVSCEKEFSSETGGAVVLPGGGSAEGELGGAPASCTNTQIIGTYGQGIALAGDTVSVEMNFTKAGTFYVTSDTVNGVYFKSTGVITATGVKTIELVGYGISQAAGNFTYQARYKGSICSFDITFLSIAQGNGSSDYFPITNTSYWKYVSSDPTALPEDTLRNTATDSTELLNGNTYNLFLKSDNVGIDTLKFRKEPGNYYQYGDLDVAGAADNVVAAEYIFLKDNVAVGTSWESPAGDADIAGSTVKLPGKQVLI